MSSTENALKRLEDLGQKKALRFWEELSEEEKEAFAVQIEKADLSCLNARFDEGGQSMPKIAPIDVLKVDEIEEKSERWKEEGLAAIREGKAAAVLLAGGMGTRLGTDGPKGVFDIGITKPVFIFQRLIENLMDVVKEAGVYPDLYIMTSEKNHRETVDFLTEHGFFGYEGAHVFFFEQETAPATDFEGQILLEGKNRLATSPNGNGGWYPSLLKSEAGAHFKASSVEWLNVFAVDNVLQRILDPAFIGAVIEGKVNTGAKVIRKNAPDEGVGVLCLMDNKPGVVEYYELTEEMKSAKDENGEPLYNYGVILNYLFRREALEGALEKQLPFHRVKKKVPCLDEAGNPVKPEEPNGYKYELLVLDLIRELSTCLGYEVVREKEFAPIKNRTGKDSVESARELLKKNKIEV